MFELLTLRKLFLFSSFIFWGIFLYGAFFAAIGSTVDNLQDASQFTLPISLPMMRA